VPCTRWSVIEGPTPPGHRAVSFGTGPIAAAVTSTVWTVVVVLLVTWTVPFPAVRLLEKGDECADRFVSAAVRAGRSRGIIGGGCSRDTPEDERCREKGDSAATKRTLHDDPSFWKQTSDALGSE